MQSGQICRLHRKDLSGEDLAWLRYEHLGFVVSGGCRCIRNLMGHERKRVNCWLGLQNLEFCWWETGLRNTVSDKTPKLGMQACKFQLLYLKAWNHQDAE